MSGRYSFPQEQKPFLREENSSPQISNDNLQSRQMNLRSKRLQKNIEIPQKLAETITQFQLRGFEIRGKR